MPTTLLARADEVVRVMRRREFITLIGGAAAAWPLVARAQQPAMPTSASPAVGGPMPPRAMPLRSAKASTETGYVEGQNVMVEYHWLDGRYDRLPSLIADFVSRPVAVIATTGPTAAAQAAKAATATIPIVFTSGLDPVQLGLVASFNRPGGNATGVSLFTIELGPKRLGLVRELLPQPGAIAFFVNPNTTATPFQVTEMQAAAQAVGQPLLIFNAGTEEQGGWMFW